MNGFYIFASQTDPEPFDQFLFTHIATIQQLLRHRPLYIRKHFGFVFLHKKYILKVRDAIRTSLSFAERREWFYAMALDDIASHLTACLTHLFSTTPVILSSPLIEKR
jgi:hypothetical protein